jgi:hypothetical protein
VIGRLLRRWRNRGVPTNHPFTDVMPSGMDWRGLPTPECFCGSRTFYAVVWFDDDREVGGYVLDGLCTDCNALVTLPTPVDFDMLEAWD